MIKLLILICNFIPRSRKKSNLQHAVKLFSWAESISVSDKVKVNKIRRTSVRTRFRLSLKNRRPPSHGITAYHRTSSASITLCNKDVTRQMYKTLSRPKPELWLFTEYFSLSSKPTFWTENRKLVPNLLVCYNSGRGLHSLLITLHRASCNVVKFLDNGNYISFSSFAAFLSLLFRNLKLFQYCPGHQNWNSYYSHRFHQDANHLQI